MACVCMQCALEAFVQADGAMPEGFVNFAQMGVVDGTPEEHLAAVHPHGVDPVERKRLEAKAAEIIKRLKG